MEISPWIRFLDLYELSYDASPATIRLKAQREFERLLERTGVYLIADGGNLIYVGQAGGRSGGSSFGARVKKHGLKALGVTNETVPGCGIADTRRWSAYRARYLQTAQAQNLNGILSNWRVRMLVLPSQNEDQRRVIDLVEQVAALVFDRTRHAGEQAMELPPCNTQQLGASLLSWLAEHPPRVDEEPQLQLQPQPQDVMEVDLADEIVPVDDEGWYDEVFERRCDGRQELVQLYDDLLREIRAVSEEPMGQEVGLCVAYTDTNTRDLRVRGDFDGFAVLMRLTRRGNGFKVYVLLDRGAPELQGLNPSEEQHDRLETSIQCGDAYGDQPGCDAQRVGKVLRAALAVAPRRRMPFAPRHRRPGLRPAPSEVTTHPAASPQESGIELSHRASAANEWLKGYAEAMPAWLKNFRPGDPFVWDAFLASRIVYYPGAGTDGQPVAVFGGSGAAHCFVYVDYGLTRQAVEHQLDHPQHGFMGYTSIARVTVAEHQLTPAGWVRHFQPGDSTPNRHFIGTEPYAFLEILQRRPDFGPDHGPDRLAIVFMGADGVSAYDALFCQDGRLAPFAVVLQDHGYGGNYTTFGAGGLLHTIAVRTSRFPEMLLVATGNTSPWPGYAQIQGAVAGGGGMHQVNRSFFLRNDLVPQVPS
jgi:hypothetical protein